MASLPAHALADPYELVSVQAVPTPRGAAGALWHRYEIAQGDNKIVGYRQGGLETVTCAVESIVTRLNERRHQQRGKVQIALQPKSGAARSHR